MLGTSLVCGNSAEGTVSGRPWTIGWAPFEGIKEAPDWDRIKNREGSVGIEVRARKTRHTWDGVPLLNAWIGALANSVRGAREGGADILIVEFACRRSFPLVSQERNRSQGY